jgi:hypothetical protein
MRADPDGPGLREPTIRIVLDRLVSVEFYPAEDTQPFVLIEQPEPRRRDDDVTRFA